MKKFMMCIIALIMLLGTLTGCGSKEVKVTCTMCNGSGEVKYYYGEGDNDYDMGLVQAVTKRVTSWLCLRVTPITERE